MFLSNNRRVFRHLTKVFLHPAFSIAVESEFNSYTKTQSDAERFGMTFEPKKVPVQSNFSAAKPKIPEPESSQSESLARIREILYKNRIRGEEFFQDFDPLRSGLVTKSVWLRCLDAI